MVKPLRVEFRVASNLADMMSVEALAQEALAESRFGKSRFSEEKFLKVAKQAASDNGRHGVLIATLRDEPLGFLYCGIGEPLVGEGVLITTVHVLYVPPALRRNLLGGKIANGLLNGALSWNKARHGQEVLLHLTSGINTKQSHVFLKRRGFQTLGGSYVKNG